MRGSGGRPLFANSGADPGLVLEERQAPPVARAGVAVRRRRTPTASAGPQARRRRTPTASTGPGAQEPPGGCSLALKRFRGAAPK